MTVMKTAFSGFPPEALRFFRQLKRNNNREWFRAHKEVYETKVKLPRILSQKEFKGLFGGLQGERLTRAPKGFPPDHPAIDLLRYKQFLAYVTRPPALAETPKLLPTIVQIFRAVMPLVRFLNASF